MVEFSDGKVDIIPETQVVVNTSKEMKSPHNGSTVADTSVDLMMQCLHGSGGRQFLVASGLNVHHVWS